MKKTGDILIFSPDCLIDKHDKCLGFFNGEKCDCSCHMTVDELYDFVFGNMAVVVTEDKSNMVVKK
jgi:hypothetical protein